jgi:thioredoxin reductase (NADPH)
MTASVTQSCDCAVIGGGPGGLATAMYLARFNRHVLLFDAGKPRACWSPRNRNYPGFPDGISGAELVKRISKQARRFKVPCVPERVTALAKGGAGFCVRTENQAVEARAVVLATGVKDVWPSVPNWEAMAGARIRACPICDAYEGNDKRLGVMGSGEKVAREALYLRTFSCEVTLFTHGLREERPIPPALCKRLAEAEIAVRDSPVARLDPLDGGEGEQGVRVCLEDGAETDVDMLFTALGCCVNAGLATDLGAELDEDGYLRTDRWQQTNVPGLYAVGDVTFEINQIAVAVGQAAIAATAVHNSLLDF